MTTVKHVLDQKGHDVHFIQPDASVFDALKIMAENNIGSLVVLEDGKLVGVITERHYARERDPEKRLGARAPLIADSWAIRAPGDCWTGPFVT